MKSADLRGILEAHQRWLDDESNGVRADLRMADLHGADLRGANLREADLRSTVLDPENKAG